jgi:hypothetical protein
MEKWLKAAQEDENQRQQEEQRAQDLFDNKIASGSLKRLRK